MGRGVILAGFVLLTPGVGRTADAPRWPLDLPPVLTSSFAEYRPNHLHAGIDFATGGRTGQTCRAVGDGSVVRMRMSPYGYGKALYVQQDDGPLVVYAHLSAFADPMAARAREEQKRRGRYTFDIEVPLGSMRVLRGAVIAWSGDTGIGVPHLHFEMRQGDVALNPQTTGFAVPDSLAPVIAAVYARPLDSRSTVHGAHASRVLPTPGPAVVVAGRIGFSVRAWDHATSREYRTGVYRCELRVDGKTLFRLVNERFDYADNHLLNLEYDQERLVERGERVQLLYHRDGDRLPGREAPHGHDGLFVTAVTLADTAVGSFAPGEHRLEVEVADVAGHRTVRHLRIVAASAIVDSVPTPEAVERFPRGQAGRADDLAPGLVVVIPAGALFEAVTLKATPRSVATLGLGSELRSAGQCLRIEPRTVALDKPITIELAPSAADTTHVGLFWINRSGDLRLLSRTRGASGRFTGDTMYLSDFALLADTTPPQIGTLHVTARGKRPQWLRFSVRDDGARMGDGGISVTLDAAVAIPEWDSETGGVIVEPDAKLGRGPHTLQVTATDQLGNRAKRTLQFTIP